MAMKKSLRPDGNLIVSVKNCDTSYYDENLFNFDNATGEYILNLQVRAGYTVVLYTQHMYDVFFLVKTSVDENLTYAQRFADYRRAFFPLIRRHFFHRVFNTRGFYALTAVILCAIFT